MKLNNIKLSVPSGTRPIDPLEIFNRQTLRGSVKGIWGPQADALKEWQSHRHESDILIQMNTGGGKTLVGLLVAQSFVNENKGRVLYVCPNNQLIEQTRARAKEIGLSPATYFHSDWTDREDFESGHVFCITNYAALFNGKSIFRKEDLDSLVLDDAHVAGNVIRGQFTLRIPRDHPVFNLFLNLCRKHFVASSQSDRFKDISEGRFTSTLFIPMYVIWEHSDEFRKILLDNGVGEDQNTLFAWEHIKEHLNHCCMLADINGIEISPLVLPLSLLKCFQPGVRRVYLTATLPSHSSFVRTFGIAKPTIIKPSGKSGEAQRLFVFVPGGNDEDQRENAKLLVQGRKCCVISPSKKQAQEWIPPASIYDAQGGQAEIDRFSQSGLPEMLGLVARYDGIDLPGDACRILILDRLPRGENLLDRFIDECIKIETIRLSQTATRIAQAIGRIFRSNTDHGVVLLVGDQLRTWVRTRKNSSYLPKLLHRQLLLAREFEKKVTAGELTWEFLIESLLGGDVEWDTFYNSYIDLFETGASQPSTEWHIGLLLQEKEAYEWLWRGQYQKAANAYGALIEEATKYDSSIAAWYRHWCGHALLLLEDKHGAFIEFLYAANIRAELGRPSERREGAFKPPTSHEVTPQAKNLAQLYRKKKRTITATLRRVEKDLNYGQETNQAEEAVKSLGDLLGLSAERPDKSKGTGPDVTWKCDGMPLVWGFELKTDKDKDSEYSKKDISQCHDHEKWLTNKSGETIALAILGPLLRVSEKANPSSNLKIIEIKPIQDLCARTKKLFVAVEGGDKTILEQSFQTWMNHYGLNWPSCVESLDNRLAIDLKEG